MSKEQVLARIINCYSSDSSDSEGDILPVFPTKGAESGPEFSIDSLLAARESECLSSPIRSVSAPILEPEPSFDEPFELDALSTVDACVFNVPKQTDFAAFRAILGDVKQVSVPQLSLWEKVIVENYPEFVCGSGAFALRCVASPTGRSFESCLKRIDGCSIDFEVLKALFACSGVDCSRVLALCDASLLANAGDAREGMFWLFMAALAEPVVAFGRYGHVVVRGLRKYLSDAELSMAECDAFVDKMLEMFKNLSPTHLSGFITFFPIVDSASARIVAMFGLKLICGYFGGRDASFEELVNVIGMIKGHYENKDEKQLLSVSAILGLTERAVVAGLKLRMLKAEVVHRIVNALRFTTGNSDASEMIQIKEQLQMTRTQLEYIALSSVSFR